jgi:hypothetical protein
MSSYNVAFVYTEKAGAYEGVITWTGFESKEKFDEWYTEDISERQQIVEEGVSEDRCVELVRTTPLSSRLNVALDESMVPDTNLMDLDLLNFNLANALHAHALE